MIRYCQSLIALRLMHLAAGKTARNKMIAWIIKNQFTAIFCNDEFFFDPRGTGANGADHGDRVRTVPAPLTAELTRCAYQTLYVLPTRSSSTTCAPGRSPSSSRQTTRELTRMCRWIRGSWQTRPGRCALPWGPGPGVQDTALKSKLHFFIS